MKDFQGFKFGPYSSKDLHLTVVSSSDRFIKNVLPSPNDYTTDIPGGNGKYYFGQTFGIREFSVNVAFEDIDETTWRRISQIFSTDKLQDLIFTENPYKTYRAKCKNAPDFKHICFRDKISGERVYKGEGSISFICYHPLAFCFNKYIVPAADWYKYNTPPQLIEDNTIERSWYNPQVQPQKITGIQKDRYNINKNMNQSWKGGYPTYEQVQYGELYKGGIGNSAEECDLPDTSAPSAGPDQKIVQIETREYWDNVPQWAKASKLLYTPTLDFDQELIYCPQYSRTNYYNMDCGLNKANYVLGSRLLVYNPGDVPIDFELKLGNLTSNFRNHNDTIFRLSRYNVQRLTIEQAVDWIGMRVSDFWNDDDDITEENWKYGTKYFTIAQKPEQIGRPNYKSLNLAHPNHCYIVEPIPQEKLGYFIKLFYWQSNLLFNHKLEEGVSNDICEINRHIFDCQTGAEKAEQYDELRAKCINDDERNQLYWNTLKEVILERYKDIYIFDENYTYDDFVYDFIFNPLEYIRYDNSLDYGEFKFNVSRFPQYMTFDYFDISNKNFNKIPFAECGCDKSENSHRKQILPLIFDSEKRLIYNWNEPQWENTADFYEKNPEKIKNFYNFKETKTTWNDNIIRGHWFQLPPGWSMIDISPLVDEDNWGGKRWLDARPFDWGDTSESNRDCTSQLREDYETIYRLVAIDYISKYYPGELNIIPSNGVIYDTDGVIITDWDKNLNRLATESLENFIQFRRWYGNNNSDFSSLYNYQYTEIPKLHKEQEELASLFAKELLQYRCDKAELGFLKEIADWWRINKPEGNDTDDWWWWANHYIWNNFPPIYWGYADLLNKATIKYIPQYY